MEPLQSNVLTISPPIRADQLPPLIVSFRRKLGSWPPTPHLRRISCLHAVPYLGGGLPATDPHYVVFYPLPTGLYHWRILGPHNALIGRFMQDWSPQVSLFPQDPHSCLQIYDLGVVMGHTKGLARDSYGL